MVKDIISLCIGIIFSYGTVAHYAYISDYSRPILISTNHGTSGEIIGELSRFPQSEILYPTLGVAAMAGIGSIKLILYYLGFKS